MEQVRDDSETSALRCRRRWPTFGLSSYKVKLARITTSRSTPIAALCSTHSHWVLCWLDTLLSPVGCCCLAPKIESATRTIKLIIIGLLLLISVSCISIQSTPTWTRASASFGNACSTRSADLTHLFREITIINPTCTATTGNEREFSDRQFPQRRRLCPFVGPGTRNDALWGHPWTTNNNTSGMQCNPRCGYNLSLYCTMFRSLPVLVGWSARIQYNLSIPCCYAPIVITMPYTQPSCRNSQQDVSLKALPRATAAAGEPRVSRLYPNTTEHWACVIRCSCMSGGLASCTTERRTDSVWCLIRSVSYRSRILIDVYCIFILTILCGGRGCPLGQNSAMTWQWTWNCATIDGRTTFYAE